MKKLLIQCPKFASITAYLDNECCANSISVVDLFGMNRSEHILPGDLEDPAEFPPVDERSRRLPVLPLEPDLLCCLSELLALAAMPPPPPKSAVCRRDSDRDRLSPLALNCFPETLRTLPPPARPPGDYATPIGAPYTSGGHPWHAMQLWDSA